MGPYQQLWTTKLARGTGFRMSIHPCTACLRKKYLHNTAFRLHRKVILTTVDSAPSQGLLSPTNDDLRVLQTSPGEGDAGAAPRRAPAGRQLGARAAQRTASCLLSSVSVITCP